MPKATKKQSGRWFVHAEVLQNGARMCSARRRLGRRGSLALTSRAHGELTLPFYPLPNGRVEFLRQDGDGVALIVGHKWDGFCTTQGVPTTLSRSDRGQREVKLHPGDYASIGCDDLRIMVKVARSAPAAETGERRGGVAKGYRAGVLSLLFPTRTERRAVAAAVLVAAVILGGFAFGLLKKPYTRFERMTDIDQNYMLAFVAPEHLENAPEALQANLDRKHATRSTIEMYQSVAAVMMGWGGYESRFLHPTTIVRYAAAFDAARAAAEVAIERQRAVDRKQEGIAGVGVLHVPTVVGETVGGSMLRIVDKLQVARKGLELNLAAKRSFIQAFPTDPEYDFEDYRNAAVAKNEHTAEYLSKIRVFSRSTDEEAMYEEATALARNARQIQARLDSASTQRRPLDPSGAARGASGRPIGMAVGASFASFVGEADFSLADDKLYRLQASEYGAPKPVAKPVKREALVGEIEPALIERFIRQNRFQLQLCYELALRRNELAAGTMEWRWRIDSRGVISELALVASSIKDQRMVDCIKNKISAWRFPRPRRGSIEVSYPFEFAPTKG